MSGIPEATPIILTEAERAELEGLARSTKTEYPRLVMNRFARTIRYGMGRTMKARNLQGQWAFATRRTRGSRESQAKAALYSANEPFRRQFSKRGQEADGLDATENSLIR